jgi:ElaB/YqjD/DUF883 family membrane-anchored ribosome-binding protein
MDAAQDLADQDTDEMRQDIDCTRSAMADKLEELEERVMGTVHSAQETVENSIQLGKDTVATVKRTFDLGYQVEQHPWAMVGGSFLVGLGLGSLFLGGRRSRPAANRLVGNERPLAPRPDSMSANRQGIFGRFDEEIDKVKGMAIGYVLGLVRDSIKDAVPQLASQIDDVMNSVTTKLGSKPVQQRST